MALYERDESRVEKAVTHWIGEYPVLERMQANADNRPGTGTTITQNSALPMDESSQMTEDESSAASNNLNVYCIPGVGRDCILGMVCQPIAMELPKFLIGIVRTVIEIGFCSLAPAHLGFED